MTSAYGMAINALTDARDDLIALETRLIDDHDWTRCDGCHRVFAPDEISSCRQRSEWICESCRPDRCSSHVECTDSN